MPTTHALVPCAGCRAPVPDIDGPTHAYLRASPGCWALYGQLLAHPASSVTGPGQQVDCYAVQHPGSAEHDRRQRGSVAVHLIALCLLLEHHLSAEQVSAARGRTSRTVLPALGMADWPHLPPPEDLGSTTVADVCAAAGADQLSALVDRWAQVAWTAWSPHHHGVRTWSAEVLRAQR